MTAPRRRWGLPSRTLIKETRMDTTPERGYEQGLAIRRQVMGDEYVDAALERVTPFSEPMQQLVTEFCWGAVWSRPGLDRRTRSLINLAMLTALGRMHEFRVHVRGAINNGCTTEEIRETLLQATVYCG